MPAPETRRRLEIESAGSDTGGWMTVRTRPKIPTRNPMKSAAMMILTTMTTTGRDDSMFADLLGK